MGPVTPFIKIIGPFEFFTFLSELGKQIFLEIVQMSSVFTFMYFFLFILFFFYLLHTCADPTFLLLLSIACSSVVILPFSLLIEFSCASCLFFLNQSQ